MTLYAKSEQSFRKKLLHFLEVLQFCKLDYTQSPLSGHSINADYLWYEIGDVVCLGNQDVLYFCFPKGGDCVARIRMARP